MKLTTNAAFNQPLMSNGKGMGPRQGYNQKLYAENYDKVFARKDLQRRKMDESEDEELYHVGPAPRPVASKICLNRKRLRQSRG